MAIAKAADTALTTTRVALQCHGAIGYATEYDLHLYMKRAWALARSMGDARFHRARVADAIL
jgi:alkylation response protein AidB-like acyl-CoA dehydrogenase